MTHMLLPLVLVAVISLGYLVRHWRGNPKSREPPLLTSSIPFIGHIIGLVRKKARYYNLLQEKHGLPCYRLGLGPSEVYIVTSPDLIKSVQKQPKKLAFPPIAADWAEVACGTSKEANDRLKINVNGEQGDWGPSITFHKMVHPSLAPGPGLDAMNRIMVSNVAASMERLDKTATEGGGLQLRSWLRHEITLASSNAVYGPMNPFLNKEVEDAFWAYQDDFGAIMMNFLPKLTARRGIYGRKVVSNYFYEYFKNNGQDKGSLLIQNRYKHSIQNGISLRDAALYEVAGSVAVLSNSSPSCFWMLFQIYSDPEVLSKCRTEVSRAMTTSRDTDGSSIHTLDINAMKSVAPLLASVFAETLRLHSLGISVRKVMQDTFLDDEYLLKKDRMVLMPSNVVHTDPSVWGHDVHTFKAERFLKDGKPKPDPVAFRAFSGGTTLCPGRHFATVETLAVVAMFLIRFDMMPVKGEWEAPTTDNAHLATTVTEPDWDIEVKVRPRDDFRRGRWEFKLPDSTDTFAVGIKSGKEKQ